MANSVLSKPEQKKRKGKAPPHAWKPGQSGNPSGRPKKDRELTKALETTVNKTKLAKKLYQLALDGDVPAIKYIYDRIDGSPTQRHEVSHDDVLDDIRRMAKERGLNDVDTEWAVKSAEAMMQSHG